MTYKEFWFSIDDVNWFIESSKFTSNTHLVTSKACEDTLEYGERFADAGHSVIAFQRIGLKKLSHDARKTGGIIIIGAINHD